VARLNFGKEHDLFRETVQGFIRDHVTPNLKRFRAERLIDRSLWVEAGAQGFLGLELPERYGGSGTEDHRFVVLLCEELARSSLALASSVGIHVDVVAPYLLQLTTEEQRARWLPGFCAGTLVTALAMTEPGAGSDLAALKTRARRDKKRWVLNGSKTFITNGTCADLVIVAARTGDVAREITLFAVESSKPGFQVGSKFDKIGQHEADTAELFFSDIELTDDDVIGSVGQGWEHMREQLTRERIHTAYVSLAHVESIFDATLEYVTTRNAFGRPIGSFQNNRFRLAEAKVELDVARTYVDRCIDDYADGRLSEVGAAKAKYFTTEIQNRIIDCCLQLHGGYGYVEEYSVARGWADARVTRIYAGSNEIMKEIIGRSLGLGEPRER
jgi:alkylation response protein AidB-like acyl-CoA dehydrogenase